MSRNWGYLASLSTFFLLFVSLGKSWAENNGDQSFHLWVAPRSFEEDSFGFGDEFASPGFPEVGFRTSFRRQEFLLEPVLSFSLLRKESKTTPLAEGLTRKSDFYLFQVGAGLRQSFWTTKSFPLAPYIEALATYHLMIGEQKTSNSSNSQISSADFNGGELGGRIGAGLQFSFAAIRPALQTELKSVWDMTDYGLDLHAYYYFGGLFRSGGFKNLSSIQSYAYGGGLYVRW